MSTTPVASAAPVAFTTGAIRPARCLREGWALIRDSYGLFLAITFVGLLIGGFGPMGVLMGPCLCGIYFTLLKRMAGEEPRFEMLFKGFDWFVPSLVVTLIQIGVTLVLLIPVGVVVVGGTLGMAALADQNGGDPPAWFFVLLVAALAVLLLIALSVACLFVFSYQLLVDRNLDPVESLKTSARATWANLGGVAGLLLLNSLLAIAGLLCCIVGVYLVMPVVLAAQLVAYRAVFPQVAEPA